MPPYQFIIKLIKIINQKKELISKLEGLTKPIADIVEDVAWGIDEKHRRLIAYHSTFFHQEKGALPLVNKLLELNEELVHYQDDNDTTSIRDKFGVSMSKNLAQCGLEIHRSYLRMMALVAKENYLLVKSIKPIFEEIKKGEHPIKAWSDNLSHYTDFLDFLKADIRFAHMLSRSLKARGYLDFLMKPTEEEIRKGKEVIADKIVKCIEGNEFNQAMYWISYGKWREWTNDEEFSFFKELLIAAKEQDINKLEAIMSETKFINIFNENEKMYFVRYLEQKKKEKRDNRMKIKKEILNFIEKETYKREDVERLSDLIEDNKTLLAFSKDEFNFLVNFVNSIITYKFEKLEQLMSEAMFNEIFDSNEANFLKRIFQQKKALAERERAKGTLSAWAKDAREGLSTLEIWRREREEAQRIPTQPKTIVHLSGFEYLFNKLADILKQKKYEEADDLVNQAHQNNIINEQQKTFLIELVNIIKRNKPDERLDQIVSEYVYSYFDNDVQRNMVVELLLESFLQDVPINNSFLQTINGIERKINEIYELIKAISSLIPEGNFEFYHRMINEFSSYLKIYKDWCQDKRIEQPLYLFVIRWQNRPVGSKIPFNEHLEFYIRDIVRKIKDPINSFNDEDKRLIENSIVTLIDVCDNYKQNSRLQELVQQLIEKSGLEDISPKVGERFNPENQTATWAIDNYPRDKIAEVSRRGFRYKGGVIRKSMVTIGRGTTTFGSQEQDVPKPVPSPIKHAKESSFLKLLLDFLSKHPDIKTMSDLNKVDRDLYVELIDFCVKVTKEEKEKFLRTDDLTAILQAIFYKQSEDFIEHPELEASFIDLHNWILLNVNRMNMDNFEFRSSNSQSGFEKWLSDNSNIKDIEIEWPSQFFCSLGIKGYSKRLIIPRLQAHRERLFGYMFKWPHGLGIGISAIKKPALTIKIGGIFILIDIGEVEQG